MVGISEFMNMDFLERMTLLTEIVSSKDSAALPLLLDLYKNPTGDRSLDILVTNALNAVLSDNEEETRAGLSSDNQALRILCIKACGEYKFTACASGLVEMAKTEEDTDVLFDIVTALHRMQASEATEIFRANLRHVDPYIATLCIRAAGERKDTEAFATLKEIVEESEQAENVKQCEVTTWQAIESLAALETEEAMVFLVSRIHHGNPTARRIVTESLIELGEPVVPLLDAQFESGDTDEKILAANIFGFIGAKPGADALVRHLDKGNVDHPNIEYAVYEALGRIGTMKGIVCLMDGLDSEDELIVMSCIPGLENFVNPGLIKSITAKFEDSGKAGRIAKAVVSSQAGKLFAALYENEATGSLLIQALGSSRDPEVLGTFKAILQEIGGDRALSDLASLSGIEATETAKRALAADDSKSLLALYRSILTDMGYEAVAVENGRLALDRVEMGEEFDIIITDMNMPVMDGMEFVSKTRATRGFEGTPIIMITTESEKSQRELADDTGVTAFLTKPFKPAALKEKIEELARG